MKKQSFLLSKATKFELVGKEEYIYDYSSQINLYSSDGQEVPAVTIEKFAPTQSKTMAKPGDDDPDGEVCY